MKGSNMRNKGNISLTNAVDLSRSGLKLALKKGACEVKNYTPFKGGLRRRRKRGASEQSREALPLSVVICTYDRKEQALEAIGSAANQSLNSSEYEIVVVNNGKADPDFEEELLGAYSGVDIRVIREPEIGLSRARNTGAENARGEYLLYIDDDAVCDFNCLAYMLEAFRKHPDAAIIGGVIELNSPEPRPDIILKGRESVWSAYTVNYKKYRTVSKQYEFPYGANFGVRRSALLELGGFDLSYGRRGGDYAGGEETALCFKAIGAGWRVGVEPNSVVIHNVSPDRYTEEHVRNTLRAGILTMYKLYADGYSSSKITAEYAAERAEIAQSEILRLKKRARGDDGLYYEIFYKECERDAYRELCEKIKSG
ncbi:MAG TPA: glycosyltransferase [Firmicutes bacterium]|nr:glycosyltransferase [Bacillota bacterium]